MTLADFLGRGPRRTVAGTDLIITGLDVPPAARLRVREMGLRAGQRVRVAQRGGFGGCVLAVGGARLAIDRATARRIDVVVAR